MVEVDEHHAIGDDALAPDRHMLERGDRALLTQRGLGADLDLALMRADLATTPDPAPAAQSHNRALRDLELHSRVDEAHAVELQPPPETQLQPRESREHHEIAWAQHLVAPHEGEEGRRSTVKRF